MHCPFCQNSLIPFEEHHLQLDRCPADHGIWFDGGELETYRQKHPKSKKAPNEESPQFFALPGLAIKNCPRCHTETLEGGRLHDMDVRHCFTCHGVFLGQPTKAVEENDNSVGFEALEGVEIGASMIEAIISAF